jgi:hypothetical protein
MRSEVAFLDCPAYMDACGATRCGLPAEVEDWYAMRSTDGPLECARIRCPRGHMFNGPIESLTRHKEPLSPLPHPGSPGVSLPPRVAGNSPSCLTRREERERFERFCTAPGQQRVNN